ncbi:MAG: hypothetical protein U0992_16025 [Planctomycetaceae bacterium]
MVAAAIAAPVFVIRRDVEFRQAAGLPALAGEKRRLAINGTPLLVSAHG